MDTTLVGFGCGRCLTVKPAAYHPDACFDCGARFDRGAALALVRVTVDVGMAGIAIAPDVDFVGEWSVERQVAIVEAVAKLFDEDDDALRPVDGGEL